MTSTLLQALEDSRVEFVKAAASVAERAAKTSPGPGRWCVLECIEHVVITEGRFLGRLQNPENTPAPPINKEREASILERMPNREEKRQAPEPARPQGRFSTLAEALVEFEAARARTAEFTVEKGDDLYQISSTHPLLGSMNGAEYIVLTAAHCLRHAAQIREIGSELADKAS